MLTRSLLVPATKATEAGAELWPSEEPAYPALTTAVERSWRATRALWATCREQMFAAVHLPDPAKGEAPHAVKRDLTRAEAAALNAAIEQFLREFRGPQGDTLEGFSSPSLENGLLQEAEYLAHAVGVGRAQQLVPGAPNPAFTAGQRRRVLEQAFQRLSEEGRLRFETRLLEIRDALVDQINSGANPLETARQLGAQCDGYERGRLRMLIRTESAFSAENATEGMYAAAGVRMYDIIGDPTTDDLCVNAQNGGPYPIGGNGPRAPLHPNCFDSMVPHSDAQGRSWLVQGTKIILVERNGTRRVVADDAGLRKAA